MSDSPEQLQEEIKLLQQRVADLEAYLWRCLTVIWDSADMLHESPAVRVHEDLIAFLDDPDSKSLKSLLAASRQQRS